MANIKRVILTRTQLNEILKEENTTTVQVNTTGNTIPSITNAVTQNQPEINTASKYGDVSLHISNPNLTGSNDNLPTQHVNVNDGETTAQAIEKQVNPSIQGDIYVSGDGISEHKSFSKKQIEEARLKKIHEGYKMTKKQLKEEWKEKQNDDLSQLNDEFRMFMDGLRNGLGLDFGDNTIAVEVFKGKTPSNDPRYVYFNKGDNRLHDDHFYIQNSPTLSAESIRKIYDYAGWDYDENCQVYDFDYVNEETTDWGQIRQMRMDHLWDTVEYYMGLKDERGELNPEQLHDAEEACNKLCCFGEDADNFCTYAREVLGLSKI